MMVVRGWGTRESMHIADNQGPAPREAEETMVYKKVPVLTFTLLLVLSYTATNDSVENMVYKGVFFSSPSVFLLLLLLTFGNE